jgi:hypothetical protein
VSGAKIRPLQSSIVVSVHNCTSVSTSLKPDIADSSQYEKSLGKWCPQLSEQDVITVLGMKRNYV